MENSILIQNLTIDGLRSIITEIITDVISRQDVKQDDNNTSLTHQATTELLKISLVTLNTATNRGDLTGYKMGNRVLYDRAEVLTAIENMKRLKYPRLKTNQQ